MKSEKYILSTNYLTLAEYSNQTFTVNQPAGNAQTKNEYTYYFDITGNTENGVIDTIQVILDGKAYPTANCGFTDSNGNEFSITVWRKSNSQIEVAFLVTKKGQSSQPFPAQTFQVQIQSYKNPLAL